MATYNGARYIQEQLDSILSELGENDEIIIVDDNSQDGTTCIIESYNDPRIKILRNKKNVGHVRSFERSIEHSRNQLLILADQDDVWKPGRVKLFTRYLFEHGALLATSNADFIGKDGGITNYSLPILSNRDSQKYTSNIAKVFLGKISYYGCAMAFRKELISLILPIPSYVESHDLWIAIAANLSKSNIHMNEKTFYRRIHDSNVTFYKRNILQKIKSRVTYIRSYFELKSRLKSFVYPFPR